MDQFNLLNLDNDERDFQYYMVDEICKNSIKLFKIIKKSRWNDNKPAMRHLLLIFFMSIIFGILKLLIYI